MFGHFRPTAHFWSLDRNARERPVRTIRRGGARRATFGEGVHPGGPLAPLRAARLGAPPVPPAAVRVRLPHPGDPRRRAGSPAAAPRPSLNLE
eukprot:1182624-Prorocentrum_minimum.AAC.2